MKFEVTIPFEDTRNNPRTPTEIYDRASNVLDSRCLRIIRENTTAELADCESAVSRTFHLFTNQQLEELIARVRAEVVDEIYNVEVGDSYE